MIKKIFVIITLILNISTQDKKMFQCGDNYNENFEQIYICIHLLNNKEYENKKTSFSLDLDESKYIIVNNISYEKNYYKIKIQTNSDQMNLDLPLIDNNNLYNYWNIVLVFDEGKLKNITADLDCWFCKEDSKNCNEIKIYEKKYKYCSTGKIDELKKKNKNNNFDLKINFSFLGTNKSKKKFTSYSNRNYILDKYYSQNIIIEK